MTPIIREQERLMEQEEKIYRELDKGIDDMEKGNTIFHDEAMHLIKERIKSYEV